MMKLFVNRQLALPPIPADVAGQQLRVAVTDSQLSSSSVLFMSSSSSFSIEDPQSVFLFKQEGNENLFLGVCSPLDLETWPVGTPDPNTGLYRTNSVSLTFRSQSILDQFWTELLADLRNLVGALDKLEPLRTGETVIIQFGPDTNPGQRFIQLNREAVVPYPSEAPTGYRLHIIAAVNSGLNPEINEIFLYKLEERNDVEPAAIIERPIGVCSLADLDDYPPTTALIDSFPAFFRKNELDVVLSNLDDLISGWDNIKFDTELLAMAWKVHLDDTTEEFDETV